MCALGVVTRCGINDNDETCQGEGNNARDAYNLLLAEVIREMLFSDLDPQINTHISSLK